MRPLRKQHSCARARVPLPLQSKAKANEALERISKSYASVSSVVVANELGYPVYTNGVASPAEAGSSARTRRRPRHAHARLLCLPSFVFEGGGAFFSRAHAEDYCKKMRRLAQIARNIVRSVEPEDQLIFLRVRAGATEHIVGVDADHLVLVRQNHKLLFKDVEREKAADSDSEGSDQAPERAPGSGPSNVIGAAAALAFEHEIQQELKNIAAAAAALAPAAAPAADA